MKNLIYGIVAVLIVYSFFAFISKDDGTVDVEDASMTTSTFDTVIDPNTNIVYIDNTTSKNYHVYTPYYGENGKICKYEDGRIIEIEE